MPKVHIHIEPDLAKANRESLARLLAADAAYNRGEPVEAEEHITVPSSDLLPIAGPIALGVASETSASEPERGEDPAK